MKLVARRRFAVAAVATATAVVAGALIAPSAYAGAINAINPTFAVNNNPSQTLTLSTANVHPQRSRVTITRVGTPANGDSQSGFTTDSAPTTTPHVTLNFFDGGSGNSDGPANPGVYSVTIVQGPYDATGIFNTNPAPQTDSCQLCFTVFPAAPLSLTSATPNSLSQGGSANVTFKGDGFTRGTRVDVLDAAGNPDTKIQPNGVPFDSYPNDQDPNDQANCSLDGQTAPCEVEITDRTLQTSIIRRVTVNPDAVTGVRDVLVTNTDGSTSRCTGCFIVNGAPLQGVAPNVVNNDPAGAASVRIDFTGSNLQQGSTPQLVFVGDAGSSTKNDLTLTGTNITYSATRVTADFDVRNAAPGTNLYQPVLTAPDGSFNACSCRFSVAQTQSPSVTGISPNGANVGEARDVTITGTRFSRGTNVTMSGTGVTVTNIVVNSAGTQITGKVQVANNAAPGKRDVLATSTDGKTGTACTGCFTITGSASGSPSASASATPSTSPCPTTGGSASPSGSTSPRPTVSGSASPGASSSASPSASPSSGGGGGLPIIGGSSSPSAAASSSASPSAGASSSASPGASASASTSASPTGSPSACGAPLTVFLDRTDITPTQPVNVTSHGSPNSVVELLAYSRPNTSYGVVRTGTTDANGNVVFSVKPGTNTRLYAHYKGGSTASDSASKVINVHTALSLSAYRDGVRRYHFQGRNLPRLSGQLITLYRLDGNGNEIRTATVKTNDSGIWRINRNFTGSGTFTFVARTSQTLNNAAGRSNERPTIIH
jgi:hypothetical protein